MEQNNDNKVLKPFDGENLATVSKEGPTLKQVKLVGLKIVKKIPNPNNHTVWNNNSESTKRNPILQSNTMEGNNNKAQTSEIPDAESQDPTLAADNNYAVNQVMDLGNVRRIEPAVLSQNVEVKLGNIAVFLPKKDVETKHPQTTTYLIRCQPNNMKPTEKTSQVSLGKKRLYRIKRPNILKPIKSISTTQKSSQNEVKINRPHIMTGNQPLPNNILISNMPATTIKASLNELIITKPNDLIINNSPISTTDPHEVKIKRPNINEVIIERPNIFIDRSFPNTSNTSNANTASTTQKPLNEVIIKRPLFLKVQNSPAKNAPEGSLLRASVSGKVPLVYPSTSRQNPIGQPISTIREDQSIYTAGTSLLKRPLPVVTEPPAKNPKVMSRTNVLYDNSNNIIRTVQSVIPVSNQMESATQKVIRIQKAVQQAHPEVIPKSVFLSKNRMILPKGEIYSLSNKKPATTQETSMPATSQNNIGNSLLRSFRMNKTSQKEVAKYVAKFPNRNPVAKNNPPAPTNNLITTNLPSGVRTILPIQCLAPDNKGLPSPTGNSIPTMLDKKDEINNNTSIMKTITVKVNTNSKQTEQISPFPLELAVSKSTFPLEQTISAVSSQLQPLETMATNSTFPLGETKSIISSELDLFTNSLFPLGQTPDFTSQIEPLKSVATNSTFSLGQTTTASTCKLEPRDYISPLGPMATEGEFLTEFEPNRLWNTEEVEMHLVQQNFNECNFEEPVPDQNFDRPLSPLRDFLNSETMDAIINQFVHANGYLTYLTENYIDLLDENQPLDLDDDKS